MFVVCQLGVASRTLLPYACASACMRACVTFGASACMRACVMFGAVFFLRVNRLSGTQHIGRLDLLLWARDVCLPCLSILMLFSSTGTTLDGLNHTYTNDCAHAYNTFKTRYSRLGHSARDRHASRVLPCAVLGAHSLSGAGTRAILQSSKIHPAKHSRASAWCTIINLVCVRIKCMSASPPYTHAHTHETTSQATHRKPPWHVNMTRSP
jgi:hypothetical protein